MNDFHPASFLRRTKNSISDSSRLDAERAVQLFSVDLAELGRSAHEVRKRIHPEPYVTFVVDRNISHTNVCVVDCDFCAFSRRPHHDESYTLSIDQIFFKIEELIRVGGTQILIQGGINPALGLDYFLDLFRRIRQKFPSIHIHSLSAVEIDFLAKKETMPLHEVLVALKEAGLHSIPGGGAEILVERVRKQISPKKLGAEEWIEFMRTAHKVGFSTTATMVFGHMETLKERVVHLERIRKLQDETRGFRAFIPWTLSPRSTPRMNQFEPAGGVDYLKTVAISRLFLDNIPNIQAGWLTEGLKLAQVALWFGANDMGGTLIEDKVLEPTGVAVQTRCDDLVQLIRRAGFIPAQRNTRYEILHVFK